MGVQLCSSAHFGGSGCNGCHGACTTHKFFLRGACLFGDKCTKRHPLDAKPTPKPCPYFVRGTCRFGIRCSNSHEASPKEARAAVPTSTFNGTWGTTTQPCRHHGAGFCRNGSSCRFVHESVANPVRITFEASKMKDISQVGAINLFPKNEALNDDTRVKGNEELPDSSPVTIRRLFYHRAVDFGDGATVQRVQTTFVLRLMEPFGDIKTTTIHSAGDFEMARVEFENHSSAKSAAISLHNQLFKNQSISAELDMGKGAIAQAVLRSTKVKVTWFAPSSIAWAHYPTISLAKSAAQRLNRKEFSGSIIQADFQQPTLRQRTSFSVTIKGLPSRLRQAEVNAFCSTNSVTIKCPQRSQFAQETIVGSILKQYGTLDAFEALPPRPFNPTVSAIAQFARPDEAAQAVAVLHRQRQPELQGSPLYVELIHAIKYQLRHSQFLALRIELERISAISQNVKLRWYDSDADRNTLDPVVVRASAAAAADLGGVKHELDLLLRGVVLCYNGEVIWDKSWLYVKEPEMLQAISLSLEVYLQVDVRTRTVRFFGQPEKRVECEATLHATLASMDASYQRLNLQPSQLTAVVRSLPQLRENFPDADINLDTVVQDIRIRGSPEKTRQVRSAVDRVIASHEKGDVSADADSAPCPICFCPADEDAVQLPCSHTFCHSCLELLLKSSENLRCPAVCASSLDLKANVCNTAIPLSNIRLLVTPSDEERILSQSFTAYVNSHPGEYHYCPSPDCEMVYRTPAEDDRPGQVLTCPSCLVQICPHCNVTIHEGLTCAEHRDQASGGYKALEQWKKEHGVRSCPKCGVDIEKAGGCNHMTCVRCKTHICWICMQTFPENAAHGLGVYGHLGKVHGGFGVY